jgi:DtxR family transcriptional regulator, Mn-dependent transcriptional regulator
MRKHRLAECLLIDVIGLDYEHVHEEACRWEHVMSERVERHLVKLLGHPTHSPYGIPIPGLEELGEHPDDDAFLTGVVSLVTAAQQGAAQVQVRRLGEPLQVDTDLLGQLSGSGVRPGSTVQVRPVDGGVVVGAEGHDQLDLPNPTASHIFVTVPA